MTNVISRPPDLTNRPDMRSDKANADSEAYSLTGKPASAPDAPLARTDRRRPGRVNYDNPHLIPLLRSPAGSGGAGLQGDEPAQEAALRGKASEPPTATLTLIDGGAQFGSPPALLAFDTEGHWPETGEFLADQVCYVAGMRVLTAKGAVTVEDLTVGDEIKTRWGRRTVAWIRQFAVIPSEQGRPELAAPICIRRGAFAEALPDQDMWVSPTHCILVGSCLVPAQLLVGGKSVVQDIGQAPARYCHLVFREPAAFVELAVSPDKVAPIKQRLAERAGRATPT
jgi:hypothetical protein